MTKKKQLLLAIIGTLVIGSGVWFVGTKVYEAVTAVKVIDKVEGICHLNEINRIEFKTDHLTTLEKQGDVWKNTEYSYLTYDQEAVNAWVKEMLETETAAVVKNADNEGTYGINDDSAMITVFDNENNAETYRIGSIMHSENKVYVKRDNTDYLLIVPFDKASFLKIEPNSFVDCKDKLAKQEISEVTYVNANGKQYMVKKDGDTWYLQGYYEMPCVIKEEASTEWLNAMNEMTLISYVGTVEDKSIYGLEQPAYKLIINNKVQLVFGKQTSDRVYVAFEGENDVYQMDKAIYTQVVAVSSFDNINKQLLHFSLEDVAKIEMTNPQASFELLINKAEESENAQPEAEQTAGKDQENQVKETQDKETQDTTDITKLPQEATDQKSDEAPEEAVALLRGQALNLKEAEEWLNTIQGSVQLEAQLQNPEIEQKEDRKAECSMIYHMSNGETIRVEFIPYDINYYILRYNGTIEFAVNKEKITKLFTSLACFSK